MIVVSLAVGVVAEPASDSVPAQWFSGRVWSVEGRAGVAPLLGHACVDLDLREWLSDMPLVVLYHAL